MELKTRVNLRLKQRLFFHFTFFFFVLALSSPWYIQCHFILSVSSSNLKGEKIKITWESRLTILPAHWDVLLFTTVHTKLKSSEM